MAKKVQSPIQSKTVKELLNSIIKKERLKCKNEIQKEFANIITDKELIFATGPAGTGKSYISISKAIDLILQGNNNFEKIIITRPAEESGEELGFLPGNLREKMEPYMLPVLDIFDKLIGKKARIQLEEKELLLIQPLGFIRGKTIDNAILIVDEAQNMTKLQMKTLLTRIGENSKFIISGDLDQIDKFKNYTDSGLYDAIKRLKSIDELGFIEFTVNDIVRNKLITKILNKYSINYSTNINKDEIINKPIPKKSVLNKLKTFLAKFT